MFLRSSDSWSNWNEMLVFEKRGKPEYTGKTSRDKRRKRATNTGIHQVKMNTFKFL